MPDEYHALASPSKSAMWLACPNSLAAGEGQPDLFDARARDLGTDKHELLAMCLVLKTNARDYLGHVLKRGFKVDAEFIDHVQTVVDGVRDRVHAYELAGATVTMEVEQDVPISQITGEPAATGRADVVLLAVWPDGRAEQCVIDAKFGHREVEVEGNTQGMMYAYGGLQKFGLVDDYRTAVIVIHQPTVDERPKEWSTTMVAIEAWAKDIAAPAARKAILIHSMLEERALKAEDFNPGPKQCMWCAARAVCPARAAAVEEALGQEFGAVTEAQPEEAKLLTNEDLGDLWPILDFIEEWAKAVRGRIEFELLQGREVPGTKLVEGRRGHRGWNSDDEAEALLKSFRLKQEQMYSFKLLGPKPILDLLKEQPRRAKKVESLIVQRDGKPHVAHISDKRPALEITPPENDFTAVEPIEVEPGSDLV